MAYGHAANLAAPDRVSGSIRSCPWVSSSGLNNRNPLAKSIHKKS
jgi:hypothetical protein